MSLLNVVKDESLNIMEELSVGPDQDEIDALVEEPSKNAVSESMYKFDNWHAVYHLSIPLAHAFNC